MITAVAVEFIFNKILCFQRIVMGTFRQMRLNFENYFSEAHLILDVKTTKVVKTTKLQN